MREDGSRGVTLQKHRKKNRKEKEIMSISLKIVCDIASLATEASSLRELAKHSMKADFAGMERPLLFLWSKIHDLEDAAREERKRSLEEEEARRTEEALKVIASGGLGYDDSDEADEEKPFTMTEGEKAILKEAKAIREESSGLATEAREKGLEEEARALLFFANQAFDLWAELAEAFDDEEIFGGEALQDRWADVEGDYSDNIEEDSCE